MPTGIVLSRKRRMHAEHRIIGDGLPAAKRDWN